MIKKAKRYFNTSGPNIPDEHFTLPREKLIQRGLDLAARRRYFTIWAPRQTGKSTYFRMLAKELEGKKGGQAKYLPFREQEEIVAGILIRTYIIQYEEDKDF